ncbi:putative rna interference and silencing protein [Diplodia seriata]|uniref:Putative rna interference and silencing protein n=1 Tax=Diplodia seriata TaxID=420778 RepID=A0A0G2E264_9PEZI|nr:putative rna interference and silencing protein [Diplodia seriata]
MERDFKSFVEGAIEPKPHSQFLLVDGGEGDLIGHFKPALELPVASGMPPPLNYGPLFVDNRATLSPQLDSQLVNSADMSAVPSRPGFAEMKGGKTVLTNHFVVDLPDNLQLFKYALAGQRLDAKSARGKKKEEMERFIKDSPTLSSCRDDFATDDISLIISWKNLYPEFSDPVRGTIMEQRTFKDTKKDEKRVVELVFERCIDINSLKNHVQLSAALGMECGPAIQALNILLLKGAAEDAESDFATFRIGNNRVFRKNGYDPMVVRNPRLGNDGWLLVCHRGYFSTITPGLGNILLNLNIATSVFFRPMKLDKFLEYSRLYFGIQDNWVNKVGRLLHGVRFRDFCESGHINQAAMDFMSRVKGYMNIQTGAFTHYGFSSNYLFKEDDFRRVLSKAADRAKLVVFIASRDQGYEEFKKVADQVEGIQSICIQTGKFVKNYTDQRDARKANNWSNYVGNVSMKLNVKVGGVNHEVVNLGRICPAVTGELPVMILGADVTHPSPGTVEGFPSIAAVVGSTDKAFGKYGGSLRLQYPDGNKKARETIMSGLMEAMVQERLDAYKKVNGQYPDKILYYRDGVGEGQYKQIKDIEISAIRDACRAFSKKAVKITAVVTTKRHHTRLYPGGGATCREVNNRGPSCPKNVIPGTTVESSIVSPDKFDFFLVSHVGIKGTSRPTYYTVIENEMDFDAKGIQNFTVDDFDAFKRDITRAWGGTENANPWHKNLNDTMFWM